jgi:hypothetical protein
LLWLFWRWGSLMNYLPGLASNQLLPILASSNYNYRHELLMPSSALPFAPDPHYKPG